MTRVGDARLGGGESLVWDERRERLYFVDCQASTLHWLDDDDATLQTYRFLEAHRDRAHRRGPARRRARRRPARHRPRRRHDRVVASDPPELGGRCNDACADLAGNIITGKLNLGPTEGSAWWWSHQHGWQIIDPGIANTNGPAVGVIDGSMTTSGLDRTLLLPVTNPHRRDLRRSVARSALRRLDWIRCKQRRRRPAGHRRPRHARPRAEPRCTLDLPLV